MGERSTATIRGVDLRYDLGGAGPAMVWGHGLTSSIASEDDLGLLDWTQVRQHARVLRYDARGHGESGSAGTPTSLSWSALAQDQLALADHLDFDAYVAGGASMGCATALLAAVAAPGRIRGLVLAIPPTAWETRAAQIDAYRTTARLIEAGKHRRLLAGAAASPTPDPFRDDSRWKDRFPELLANEDPARLAQVFRGAAAADLPNPEAIAGIDLPTLILAWTGDPGHPVTTAARLQELMPHSRLVLATTPDGLAAWTREVVDFVRQL